MDGRLDPPHGIGGKPETLLGLEAFDRLHQADMAFRDHVGDWQTVTAIALGDLGHEAQMTGDELMRGIAITALAPAFGQREFFLTVQHREPPDFFKIMSKAEFSRKDRPRGGAGHAQSS